jgi:serine/threonine protein kinase
MVLELKGLKHKLEIREEKEEQLKEEVERRNAEMNQKIDELQKQLFESKFVTNNPTQLAAEILPMCHEDIKATMEGLSKKTIAFPKNLDLTPPSTDSLENAHQAHYGKMLKIMLAKTELQAHDSSGANYLIAPIAKADFTFTKKHRHVVWSEVVLIGEIKRDVKKAYSSAFGQAIDRIMCAFKHNPNRTLMYAVIADYTRVEIIKVSKEKGYSFSRTGLQTIIDDKQQPGEGYWLLGNLLSSSLDSLGFKELIQPKLPIQLLHGDDGKSICNVDNLTLLREGTHKCAYLWKASYQMEQVGVKRRKKFQDSSDCILKYSRKDNQVRNEMNKLPFLDHPSIPKLVASGYSKELGNIMVIEPYGIPIQELPSTPDETLQFMIEINDALCYAHQKETLHCDVSPNNIVVSNGRAFLIDWGISMTSNVFPLSHFTGTSAFCSLPVLRLAVVKTLPVEKSPHMYEPRDDFESLFYTLLHLLSKKPLPWMKTRDIESLYNSKCTWMYRNWELLQQMMTLPDNITNQLNIMHNKLFSDRNVPVDSLF